MYKRILVALDGSDTASRALDIALDLAAEHGAHVLPLYVIDVPAIAYGVPGFDPSIIRDAFEEEGKRITSDASARIATRSVAGAPRVVEVAAPGEDVAHRINEMAHEWHADLIVMGTHGRRGFRRMVLGSVAERVLRGASCPVLMIPVRTDDVPSGTATDIPVEKELT
ncbi:universal stress protein [Paraburkholderia phymatum]|uniref:UspA domain protein n=1 Tax=Paraburkholderia phymatum (strain DSM 17167 / CIP 108236 / LMG 21445 / STM815) TaxID=391038 RepID=B2JH85_PARP8|nr:universal stress protein [Paraburkholderia phymatum]ACC70323.1 UspA domain protein [Paraburkholderia phymatum STM815]